LLENLLLRAGNGTLGAASKAYYYHLNLSEMARDLEGCIIRAGFFGDSICFSTNPDLPICYWLLSLSRRWQADGWREVLKQLGIPVPAFSASLDYFDSYRRDRLQSHQAQRLLRVPYLRAR